MFLRECLEICFDAQGIFWLGVHLAQSQDFLPKYLIILHAHNALVLSERMIPRQQFTC